MYMAHLKGSTAASETPSTSPWLVLRYIVPGGQPWAGLGPWGQSHLSGGCRSGAVPPKLSHHPCPALALLGVSQQRDIRQHQLRVAGTASANWTQPQSLKPSLPWSLWGSALPSVILYFCLGRLGTGTVCPSIRMAPHVPVLEVKAGAELSLALQDALTRHTNCSALLQDPPCPRICLCMTLPTEISTFLTNPKDKLFFKVSLVFPVHLLPNPLFCL